MSPPDMLLVGIPVALKTVGKFGEMVPQSPFAGHAQAPPPLPVFSLQRESMNRLQALKGTGLSPSLAPNSVSVGI